MVLLGHAGLVPSMPGLPNVGVAIFFALSAFLLTCQCLAELGSTGSLNLRRFYFRRALRIMPLYFTAVLVAALVFPKWLGVEWPWVIAFLSNWSLALYGFLGHLPQQPQPIAILWSVSVEEQFYAVLPVLIFAASRLPRQVLKIGGLVVLSMTPIIQIVFWKTTMHIQPGFSVGGMYYATFSYVSTFALGAIAAVIYARSQPAMLKPPPWVFVVMLLLVMNYWASSIWTPYTVTTIVSFAAVSVASAGLILALARSPSSVTSQVLLLLPFKILGTFSFSLYVWHMYAIRIAERIASGSGVVSVGLAVVFGLASYIAIERPMITLRNFLESKNSSLQKLGA